MCTKLLLSILVDNRSRDIAIKCHSPPKDQDMKPNLPVLLLLTLSFVPDARSHECSDVGWKVDHYRENPREMVPVNNSKPIFNCNIFGDVVFNISRFFL